VSAYAGSRFADVWRAVAEAPYEHYPLKRVGPLSAIEFVRKNIYRSARRTLVRRDDLLGDFDKLVHPVGICLRGTWQISEPTRYTGYFRTGSKGLLIARASDGMGEYRPGKLRFLGIAGKLYPTSDAGHREPLETANFVMLENLGGSHTAHFVDATLSTDLLPLWPRPGLFWKIPAGLVAAPAFALADRALSAAQPMIRQLYPIAELGEPTETAIVAPTVMRLVGTAANRRVATSELREELSMVHHPNGLRFEIQVADRRSYLYPRGFRRIGEVHFTESVASYAGDHRLHFAHAPYVRSRKEARASSRRPAH
jgi:hypothetical protein